MVYNYSCKVLLIWRRLWRICPVSSWTLLLLSHFCPLCSNHPSLLLIPQTHCHTPTSGPLYILLPLLELFFIQISSWFPPSPPLGLYSTVQHTVDQISPKLIVCQEDSTGTQLYSCVYELIVYGCFCTTAAESKSCNRDQIASKA